jgi:hypothetical protein
MARHEDRDFRLVLTDRLRDLQRSKHETARGVQHEVDWHVDVRHLDGAQNVFGIVNVDVACNRKASTSATSVSALPR